MYRKTQYEKPSLRKVRLEVKTSVLSVCNTSFTSSPKNTPEFGAGCVDNHCLTKTP